MSFVEKSTAKAKEIAYVQCTGRNEMRLILICHQGGGYFKGQGACLQDGQLWLVLVSHQGEWLVVVSNCVNLTIHRAFFTLCITEIYGR